MVFTVIFRAEIVFYSFVIILNNRVSYFLRFLIFIQFIKLFFIIICKRKRVDNYNIIIVFFFCGIHTSCKNGISIKDTELIMHEISIGIIFYIQILMLFIFIFFFNYYPRIFFFQPLYHFFPIQIKKSTI